MGKKLRLSPALHFSSMFRRRHCSYTITVHTPTLALCLCCFLIFFFLLVCCPFLFFFEYEILLVSLCFLPIFPLLIPHHLFPPLGLLFLVLLDILSSLPLTAWGFPLPMGEARLSPAPPPTLPLVTELELVLFIPSSISSLRYRCWQSTWSCHFCLVLRRESYHVSLVHEMNLNSRECHDSSWRL